MIFFFLAPSIPAVLGNFLIPLMVGARDVAFPRLNLLSWYIFMLGGIVFLYSTISGGVDTGWTFYTPLSTTYANSSVMSAAMGVFISGFSSILTGLNFIVTIHMMRAPGLTWFRLPLFLWSLYATSIIFILAMPVIAVTMVLLMLERFLHVGIFDPALGGDPILFQHLFWFFGHPEVYVLVLPAMGVVSELIAAFSRKRVFGYGFVAFSSVAIAFFLFLCGVITCLVSGQSIYAGLIFSAFSFLVAIPSAIKVFNWTATLYKGSISYVTLPMLYALGFIGLFTMGGLTGLFLASTAIDVHVHDTYFLVAHFHFIMVGGAVMGYLGGIHYWWPKMTGRMLSRGVGPTCGSFGFYRIYPNLWSAIRSWLLGDASTICGLPGGVSSVERDVLGRSIDSGRRLRRPLIYLMWSARYGPIAGPNPWGAKGLEWTTTSPPPTENFEVIPIVTEEAYAYGAEKLQHA